MEKIFLFSDIDDTLIQTKRKTDFSKTTIVGAYNKEGEENSFFYEGTKRFIDKLLEANITFIPTTARNLESYKRTIFYKHNKIKYVILNFGGLILKNGAIDKEWENNIKQKYQTIISLEEIFYKIQTIFKQNNLEMVIKIIDNYYISIYNKKYLDNKEILKKLKTILEKFIEDNNDFYLYENGNSFGILPIFLNKKFGVEYLIKQYNPILTIGAGDNLSDLDFMNLTDFHLIPTNSFINYKNML